MGEMELDLGRSLRALVEDVTSTHVELVQVSSSSSGEGGDPGVLDTLQDGRRKGKSVSRFGCKDVIRLGRMNRQSQFPVATTVAKGFTDSDETGEKDVRHQRYLSHTTRAAHQVPRQRTNAVAESQPCVGRRHPWTPAAGKDTADK